MPSPAAGGPSGEDTPTGDRSGEDTPTGGPSGRDKLAGGPRTPDVRRAPSRLVRYPLAGVAILALADTAIVALALPPILRELHTDVAGVAAVLGVYAVVLAVALLPAERLGRMHGIRTLGLAGVALFGMGSLVCGLADALGLLLVARAVQAVGGAALLVTAHAALVGEAAAAQGDAQGEPAAPRERVSPPRPLDGRLGDREPHGLRLWRLAALLGTAAGPAIGGALTQALGWRSIFLVQAPAALAALPACLSGAAATVAPREAEPARSRLAPAPPTPASPRAAESAHSRVLCFGALALLSGAIAAALFLTVLLLISGWGIEPLAGALVVSVMPLSALAAIRIGGPPAQRAAAGAFLVAAGAAALAFLPNASVAWTILPQLVIGVGMGLSLAALAGELLPDRDSQESARLLTLRHAGIALALLILAPIAQHELDTTLEDTRLRGAALILDARIDPQLKLEIAPRLGESVETEDPRGGLERVFADARDGVDDEQLPAYDDLASRADDLLVTGVNDGFRTAFLVAAGLALLAAAPLAVLALAPGFRWRASGADNAASPDHPRDGRRVVSISAAALRALSIAAAVAAVALAAYAALANAARPDPVEIANPCQRRPLPSTGGVTGFAQDAALVAADVIACRVGSSREELVLGLADDDAAHDYEERYGVNPRSALEIAERFLPG